MITKKFGVDFFSEGGALTLYAHEVCEEHESLTGQSSRTHADGWTIAGIICEDYYYWVNHFEASHPVFGRVWGNFDEEVYADSEAAFQDFYARHTPEAWDYGDI